MKTKSLSWIEVDTAIFKSNIRQMASMISKNTRIMLMVKGNAYGHGLVEMSKVASKLGISYLGVSSLEEAITLRKSKITIPILLLTEVEPIFIHEVIKYKITPTVYSLEYAQKLSQFALIGGKVLPIHIKIDSGLNRFGFKVNDASKEVVKISNLKNLYIEGIFTHFADAIDNLESSKKQLELFNNLCSELKQHEIYPKYRHVANSPALVWLKNSHLDLVRFGLASYGLQPSDNKKYPLKIRSIMTWKTKIFQVKHVKQGEYIGYSNVFQSKKDMDIAVIGVGYADGFRRTPLNFKYVLVKGEKCAVLGNVTMNFSMIDVSKIQDIKAFDEVVIVGKQGKSIISFEEIASNSGTINEEIVTSISPLIPRFYK